MTYRELAAIAYGAWSSTQPWECEPFDKLADETQEGWVEVAKAVSRAEKAERQGRELYKEEAVGKPVDVLVDELPCEGRERYEAFCDRTNTTNPTAWGELSQQQRNSWIAYARKLNGTLSNIEHLKDAVRHDSD